MAHDGDLMMRLADGVDETRGIIEFLYSHKAFKRMAVWLIQHGYTGRALVDYFQYGHKLSMLRMIREIKKYELSMDGDIFDHEFNDVPTDRVGLKRG